MTKIGTPDDDILIGTPGNDLLYGLARNDRLYGGVGADQLYGGSGQDLLDAGSGDDLLLGGSGDDRLLGGSGVDRLYGGDGVDHLDGGTGADTLDGGAGNDFYIVDDPGDVIVTGPAATAGYDRVDASISYAMPGVLWKLVLTGTGDLSADGNASDNAMFGNVGDNRMSGGAGADIINASIGDDIVNGGLGHDQLTGAAGRDRFVFSNGGSANADQLLDFQHADDTIVLADRLDGSPNLGLAGLHFDSAGRLAADSFHAGAVAAASGIYVTSAGDIYYNPTSAVANDTMLLATVSPATAATLDRTDFVSAVHTSIGL